MFEYWLMMILVSILATIVARLIWKHEFDFGEIAITIAISSVITAIIVAAGSYDSMADTQVINGHITEKTMERVHCRHSYDCHCYTTCSGFGKSRSCSRRCQTCYEHSFDNDWIVKSTVGNFDIDTVDRQGLIEPPRWTITNVGEPAATVESYSNYIKAAPDSLFNTLILKQNKYVIPEYPNNVYDYYRINRVIQHRVNVKYADWINQELNNTLIKLGPNKEVNIVSVFTSYDKNFARALEANWLGGKKNDVVIVTGLDEKTQKVKWNYVFSWSKKSLVNYEIMDDLNDMNIFDARKYVSVLDEKIKKSFVRRSMEEYKYLEDAIVPPDWVIYTGLFFAIFGSFGMGFFLSRRN